MDKLDWFVIVMGSLLVLGGVNHLADYFEYRRQWNQTGSLKVDLEWSFLIVSCIGFGVLAIVSGLVA